MPACQHDHVGDPQRALHERADLVALLDVLPPARLGAAAAVALAGVRLVDARRSRRRCTARSRSSSYFLRSVGLRRARCGSSAGTGRTAPGRRSRANTSAVHSCTARSANSLSLSCTPTSALRRVDPRARAQRVPPLAEATRSRTRARRRAGRPSAAPWSRPRAGVDLVLADERVAADEVGRGDRAAPAGARRRSRDRTTAGCRRRRPRRRGGTRPRSGTR